jgi:hypothetical protein
MIILDGSNLACLNLFVFVGHIYNHMLLVHFFIFEALILGKHGGLLVRHMILSYHICLTVFSWSCDSIPYVFHIVK